MTGAHGFEDAFWRLFSLNPVGGGGGGLCFIFRCFVSKARITF